MTTLDSLNTKPGVAVQIVVAIEGIPYLLTDGDAAAALTAFQSSNFAGHTDYTSALGGLSAHWDMRNKIDPWKPFTEPSTFTFRVVPATNSSGVLVDTFGVAVGRRIPATETRLADTAVDCDATAIVVKRADDFAASGDICLGPETIGYSSRDTGTDTFTVAARGKYHPFHVEDESRFARTHKPIPLATATGDPLGVRTQIVVGSAPVTWIGRWVGVWLLERAGGMLDIPGDTGHMAFAGVIVEIGEDDQGATVVTLEDPRRRIFETALLRDQFTAQLKDGYYLAAGQTFIVATSRDGSAPGIADPLVVVAGVPASANEMQAGFYSAGELADAINAWMASEKTATRILFNCRYVGFTSVSEGLRATWTYSDSTTTAGVARSATLTLPSTPVAGFLGWDDREVRAVNDVANASTTSPLAPRRFMAFGAGSQLVALTNPSGTWWNQADYLPAGLGTTAAFDCEGILKIGDNYVRAKRVSDTEFSITSDGVDGHFAAWDVGSVLAGATVEDETTFVATQVAVVEGVFNSLLLKILLSTGTTGFNSSSYDVLPEQMGCAIPYSLLTSGFLVDLLNLETGSESLCARIEKPTRFVDMFEADFLLRGCYFRWVAGRLGVGSWSSPVASLASITLDETSKAVPASSAGGDNQRATLQEDDSAIFNMIKIRSGLRADGSFADELTIQDASSIRDHGQRTRTIEARNTAGNSGTVGASVKALIASFTSMMPLFSRPFYRIKTTLARTYFEQASVGTVATFSDRYLRDPSTGLRYSHATGTGGISNLGALVIGSQFDWGGGGSETGGEVDLMVVPRQSNGPYVPCAQVDETHANAGYNAATFALTCYAHEHSQSTDVADASWFGADDAVRIIEIDPMVASAATTWTRAVASVVGNVITLQSALSSPAWDSAKKYRVIFDSYANCEVTQTPHVFQADDADGLVADSRQAYEMISSGAAQSASYEESVATDLPARHSTLAYGDGVPLDVGYERDAARLANNLLHYKGGRQAPQTYGVSRTYSGTGAYRMTDCQPVFVGMMALGQFQTRKLYVAPQFKSTDGASATVRLTLLRHPPSGDSLDDVTRSSAYQEATFTTTSTTYVVPDAQGLDVRHLRLADGAYCGIGYLIVEVTAKAEHIGLARRYVGPVDAP